MPPVPTAEKKQKNVFQRIAEWFTEAAEWIQENLGDPAIAKTLTEDLNLNAAAGAQPALPASALQGIKDYQKAVDPEKAAFEATVTEIKDVVDAILTFADAVKGEGMTAGDVVYLVFKVGTVDSLRVRLPWLYALAKLVLLVSDDADSIEELDPDRLLKLLRGEPQPPGASELVVEHIFEGVSLVVLIAQAKFEDDLKGILDAYYGWDPAPDSATPVADRISSRALTIMIGDATDGGGGVGVSATVTLLGVPREHGGPGIFTSFGGALSATNVTPATTYKFEVGATGGLDFFIPFKDATEHFQAGGAPSGFVKLDAIPTPVEGEPALRIGQKDSTRIDIGALGWGFELAPDRAGFRASIKDGSLVVVLGEGDGFLQQLPG